MMFAFSLNAVSQNLTLDGSCSKVYVQNEEKSNSSISYLDINKNEYWYGYWDGLVESTSMSGNGNTPMSYDAAVCFPAGTFEEGISVQGLKFALLGGPNLENFRMWMSTELPNSAEEANIVCEEILSGINSITNPSDQCNEIRFSKPYSIDVNKDLYVGFSFYVPGGDAFYDQYPILSIWASKHDGSFYYREGGADGQWDDKSWSGVLALQVLLSRPFDEYSVDLPADLGNYTTVDRNFSLPVTVKNLGTKGFENLTINVDYAGMNEDFDVLPNYKVEGINTACSFDIPLEIPAENLSYDVKVTVTKINGVETKEEISGKATVNAISRVVDSKVFVEEFTGMWCGWCPRGIVGMQKIHETYGDEVVLASVHVSDALNCKDYDDFVNNTVSGYPNSHVNRTYMCVDPYQGSSSEPFGIKDDIDKCREMLPLAEIDARLQLDGDILTATSEVTFLFSGDGSKYAVSYILVENGMQDESWSQANSYSQYKDTGFGSDEPLFDPWVNGEMSVKDIVYDDVVIAAMGVENGVEGSVPATVEEEVVNSHSVEFDLSTYKCIQNVDNMALEVVLLDKTTGKVVNSNLVRFDVNTGIENVGTENVKESARYTVDGRRINTPEKGVNIIKYSDGTTKKVVIR